MKRDNCATSVTDECAEMPSVARGYFIPRRIAPKPPIESPASRNLSAMQLRKQFPQTGGNVVHDPALVIRVLMRNVSAAVSP